MNTLRANYIMQQVFIKANHLIENPVATRHKSLDVSVVGNKSKLSYGYSIDADETGVDGTTRLIKVQMNGVFSKELCEILKDKVSLSSGEYSGLRDILLDGAKSVKNGCTNENFSSMKFIIDPEFKKQ